MNFEDVQIGQMFHYDDRYRESWIVIDKRDNWLKTMYIVNTEYKTYSKEVNYTRQQWNSEDYFKLYFNALKQAGYNVTVEDFEEKYEEAKSG